MDILLAVFFLIFGFGLLVYGGNWLVDGAISLAKKMQVSPTLIGLTVVAAGTSAPEFVTTTIASLNGNNDLATGNVVGSNIFNILVILGLTFLLSTSKVPKVSRLFELPSLLLFSALFYFFSLDLKISRFEGGTFLFIFSLFIITSIYVSKLSHTENNDLEEDADQFPLPKDLLLLALGIGALTGGAHFALKGAITLGELFGLSERIIGITIVSIGTGLPELATSTAAALKKQNDLAIANVVGSNIMNTLIVLGGASLISPLIIGPQILNFDLPFMLATTALFFMTAFFFYRRITWLFGVLFLGLYIGYTISLITGFDPRSFLFH